MRVLVDTSALVRLREWDNPMRLVCEQSIRHLRYQQQEICICTQVLIEFWSVATRPIEMNGLGMSPEQAFEDCYAVRGKQVHDARLLAFAQACGMTHILTLNPQDFARYAEASTLLPQQIARSNFSK